MMAIAARILGPRLIAAVPWRLIAWALLLAGIAAAALAVRNWHVAAVAAAWTKGSDDQAAADGRAVTRAFVEAKRAQHAIVAAAVTRNDRTNREQTDALATKNDRLGRDYADLRMRWTAARRAAAGAAGGMRATHLPGGAGGDDAAACSARGWVDFDVAAAAAEAADRATALVDTWQDRDAKIASDWPTNRVTQQGQDNGR